VSPFRCARPDPSDPIQALAACYARFVLAQSAHPDVLAAVEPDLIWTLTGIPIAGFNRVMGARIVSDAVDERIVDVIDRYRERGSSVSWWIDPATEPADLAERLGRHGFVLEEQPTPAMALDLAELPPPVVPAPDGPVVREVRDHAGLRVAVEVALEGFGGPATFVDALHARLSLIGLGRDGPLQLVVAALGDRPVATAAAFVAGDVAAVYNVATVEDARGRGIGREVTIAVCRAAAERGARVAVLESTAMGYPVYRRLGFRDAGSFRIWHRSSWE
jgi:ribosomal protein S18 acetylase RimI-like enzyme